MSTTYNGCEILQVTPGQCACCGARWVFSVLVAQAKGDSDRKIPRAFHTCDRGFLPGHYSPHACRGDLARDAA